MCVCVKRKEKALLKCIFFEKGEFGVIVEYKYPIVNSR